MSTELKGCNIALVYYYYLLTEKDINDDVQWAWSYPTVTNYQRDFVLRKFTDSGNQSFSSCKHNDDWCYIYTSQVSEADSLFKIKQFAVVLWSPQYCPRKYGSFCKILSKRYCKSGDPVAVLQLYLSIFTKGSCTTEENGTFVINDFHSENENVNSHISALISAFGLETILIYTALLLNKRIFVYDHNLTALLQTIEVLPLFMTHRDLSSCVYPWVHLVHDEIIQLKRHNGYIAGTLDSSVLSRTDLFDLVVNMAAREITISPHAREAFTMTKTHKDIALFLVRLGDGNESQLVPEIARKTLELLTQLRSLATTVAPDGKKMFSIETLRDKKFPPALENFLFNLAVAENIMLL